MHRCSNRPDRNNLTSVWQQDGLSNSQISNKLQKYNFDPAMKGITTLPKAQQGSGYANQAIQQAAYKPGGMVFIFRERIVYSGDGGTTNSAIQHSALGVMRKCAILLLLVMVRC